MQVVNAARTPRDRALVALSYASKRKLEDVLHLTLEGYKIERPNMSSDLRKIFEMYLCTSYSRIFIFKGRYGTLSKSRAATIIREAFHRWERKNSEGCL